MGLHLTVVYERDEEGWWVAEIPEVPGAVSQGRTREEAREMVLDAMALAFEVRREKLASEGGEREILPLFGLTSGRGSDPEIAADFARERDADLAASAH